MIEKCLCEHCGGSIEFDLEQFASGSKANCPHCGKETLLTASSELRQSSKPKDKSADKKQKKSVIAPCPDCSQPASINAYFCPHCGTPLPAKPSLFDTVLRVTLSVIVISLVIGFLAFMGLGIITALTGAK